MGGSTLFFRTTTSITFLLLFHVAIVSCNGIFKVHHKFAGRERSLNALKEHDNYRHGRFLSTIDLPVSGIADPSQAGLYYVKIGLGTPEKDFYVQVDTGSDISWMNCMACTNCPIRSNIVEKLTLYNPSESTTAKVVTCGEEFCSVAHQGSIPECKANAPCEYNVAYGDGSGTEGYLVQDNLQYKEGSGNLQNSLANVNFIFGCGTKQTEELASSNSALDGILGFGQANSSVISQLASSGIVKKVFSHCLDGEKGGGIFAIGNVIEPKVSTTPLVPNAHHYNVNLKEIKVGDASIQLPSEVFDSGAGKGTIIDSGTTLAYLPNTIYQPLMNEIMSRQPDLRLETVEGQFQCFNYDNENLEDVFPVVSFGFDGSLTLRVYPHEYLFKFNYQWCFGWLNGGVQTKDMIVLGDSVLSNKLVVYDLVNQVIGWTEYDCSSGIKLKD